MKPWEKWSFAFLSGVLTITGILYLWMKYLLENDDPFSVINHPLQPLMLDLHILAAPLFLFLTGYLIHSHVAKKLTGGVKANRKTGIVSLIMLPLMTISGYALQIFAQPAWLRIALILHLSSGIVFAGSYLTHLLISYRLYRRQAWRKEDRSRMAA